MRAHAKPSKEVAIGTAMASRSPLAGQADPRPIIGARRNSDVQGLSLRAPGSLWTIEIDSFFGAERRFVEVKDKRGLKICASPGAGRLRSTSEEILEDIPEALSITEVLREVTTLETARRPAKIFGIKVWIQSNFAKLIVLFFALLIRENRIGGRHPLELFFGLGIALVSVRMIFLGETAIGLLDRGRISGPRNTEFYVRILALMAIQWLLVASPVRVSLRPDASFARS